jgi:hypothetical protein
MKLVSRTSLVLVATLTALSLGPACSDEEIVLATVSPTDAGPGDQAKRCVDNRDCSATTFCSRKGCGDLGGTCEARPVVCEEGPMPVCGCDGITYWNDCLRRTVGTSLARPGECSDTALLCGMGGHKDGPGSSGGPGSEGCPFGSFCARLLPPDIGTSVMCPFDVTGTCWALPAICPEHGGPDRWIHCDPSKSFCTSTCEAIRTGDPHKRATSCP